MDSNTKYICELLEWQQDKVRVLLRAAKLTEDEILEAMNSRLCDLEDTIPLDEISEFKEEK